MCAERSHGVSWSGHARLLRRSMPHLSFPWLMLCQSPTMIMIVAQFDPSKDP